MHRNFSSELWLQHFGSARGFFDTFWDSATPRPPSLRLRTFTAAEPEFTLNRAIRKAGSVLIVKRRMQQKAVNIKNDTDHPLHNIVLKQQNFMFFGLLFCPLIFYVLVLVGSPGFFALVYHYF